MSRLLLSRPRRLAAGAGDGTAGGIVPGGDGLKAADLDVAVVGGGPSGMAAAVELRRLGVRRVLVVEREPELGGIPRDCHHPGFGWPDLRRLLSGPAYARRWAARVRAAGAESWTESSVTCWRDALALQVTSPRGVFAVSADAVLLATGCRERPRTARLVPGDRPAGVFTTGSLQRLVHATGDRVGRRAVVVGAEHVSFSAVHTLTGNGAEVAAVVTDLPRHQTYAPFAWFVAGRRGIPILADSEVARISGGGRVESVEVRHRPTGASRRIACDTVVFTGDWIPDHELARAAGLLIDRATRGPQVDAEFRTSGPGVFAAGNLLHGAETAGAAALEGRAAAASIARFLKERSWFERAPVPVVAAPPLGWISPGLLVPQGGQRMAAPFVMRVAEFLTDGAIEVRQAARTLHRSRFRKLIPNRSIRLSARWTEDVDPGAGPVVVSAGGAERRENATA